MQSKTIDRVTLLNITLIVEALLLSAATLWSWMASIQLVTHLSVGPRPFLIGLAVGLAMAVVSYLLLLAGKTIGFLSGLRETIIQEVAPIFSQLSWTDALLVAVVSGFCEEVLFRGVIQSQCGLLATSIIFALFHCPGSRYFSYGIWAFAAGLLLGWLYIVTGSLWVPIVAHATSNAISLVILRYGIKTQETKE